MISASLLLLLSLSAPQDATPANAADLYRQAFEIWMAASDADRDTVAEASGSASVLVFEDPALQAAQDRLRPAIDLFVEASNLGRCDWGIDYSEGFATLLPHLGPMRQIARAAASVAASELAAGRTESALGLFEAVGRSAGQLLENPVLIDSLVSGSMLALSARSIDAAIDAGAVDAAAAARLRALLPEHVADAIALDRAVLGEPRFVEVELDRLAAGGEPIGDEFADLNETAARDPEATEAALAMLNEFSERAAAALVDPDPAARAAALEAIERAIEAKAGENGIVGLLLQLVPSYGGLGRSVGRIEDALEGTRSRLDAIAGGADAATLANAAVEYLRAAAAIEATSPRLQVAFELLRQEPLAADDSMRSEAQAWLERLEPSGLAPLRRAARAARCDFDFGAAATVHPSDSLLREALPTLRGGSRLLLVQAQDLLEQAKSNASAGEDAGAEAARLRAQALENLCAVATMARHLAGDGTIGGTLASASILRELASMIDRLRVAGLLEPQSLESLEAAVTLLPRGGKAGPLGVDAARQRVEIVARSLVASSDQALEQAVASREACLRTLAMAGAPAEIASATDEPLIAGEDLVDRAAWAALFAAGPSIEGVSMTEYAASRAALLQRVLWQGEIVVDPEGEALPLPCSGELLGIALEALAAVDASMEAAAEGLRRP